MQLEQLEYWREQIRSRMPLVGWLLRRRAVRHLAAEASPAAVRVLAAAVGENHDKTLPSIALAALWRLAKQQNQEAREALCRAVIRHDLRQLQEQLLQAGYLPVEEHQRAVFFFMTEQWDRYESLDFDHSLLRTAYEGADERLRKRIAAKARQAGRLEWVDVVSGGRRGRRLASLTDGEWRAALSVLRDNERWDEIWKLAQEAPPRRGVSFMRQLDKAGWQPPPEERADFQQLAALAPHWNDDDFQAFMQCRATLRGHRAEIHCMAFSPNGKLLATGSGDKTVHLWSVPDGKALEVFKGHRGQVTCLAFHPHGRLVISGGKDGAAWIWPLSQGVAAKKLDGHTQRVTCLAVTPNGEILATGSADSSIQLWSLPSGQSLRLLPGHDAAVVAMAITPDGSLLASAGGDSTARLWNLPEGRPFKTLEGHRDQELDAVLSLAINPAGDILATGGTDGIIKLWSLPGCLLLHNLREHKRDVACLAFSANGKLVASGGGDNCVRVWDIASGKELAGWEAHCGPVTQVAIHPDGAYLASVSGSGLGQDQSIRLWSIPEGRGLKSLYGHQRSVSDLAMSPNGKILASTGGDRTVRLWSAELTRLSQTPIQQATLGDLELVRGLLSQDSLSDVEIEALTYMEILFRRHRRHDILVGEAAPRIIELGEFDIEIESR
jgi:WD40 repeat protein